MIQEADTEPGRSGWKDGRTQGEIAAGGEAIPGEGPIKGGGGQGRTIPGPPVPTREAPAAVDRTGITRAACMAGKICVLGDSGVGKTSLVRRFAEDRFDMVYRMTCGASVTPARADLDYGEHGLTARLSVRIWDVTGEIGPGRGAAFLRGASGALVVADASRPESQTDIRRWIEEFRAAAGDMPVVIALNKADIIDRQQFDTSKLIEICQEYDCVYMFTSARRDEKVDKAFFDLFDIMARNRLIYSPEAVKD